MIMNKAIENDKVFELLIPVREIKSNPIEQKLALNQAELKELSNQLDLISIESLECDYKLRPTHKNRIEFIAQLKATLTQLSAVSLEPISKKIDENFTIHFWPSEQNDPETSPELDLEYAEETIEFYEGEHLDIGQIIYEQFVISLDLYPRAEGETFAWENADNTEREELHPFAALKKLKTE